MSTAGRQPPNRGLGDDSDQELIQMWKEQSFPAPGTATPLSRQLADWVERFDRRVFWRNFVEYVAAVVVVVRAALEISVGDRYLIAPLTSIAAVLFIVVYLWWKHRTVQPLDPSSDMNSYRTALLTRIDRQIELTRRVRYWYILPAWIFFLTVFVSGAIKVVNQPPERVSIAGAVLGLALDFLAASTLCVVTVWLNERFGVRRLREERTRVLEIQSGSIEGGSNS